MQLGPARILICPHCGIKKEIMSLISGNTFNAEYWSDGKRIASMLPEISLIQKCPSCNRYYLIYKQSVIHSEDDEPSFEQGLLSYPELKEAFAFLKEELINDDELSIRMMLVHGYNDWFYRSEEKHIVTEDEECLFVDNVKHLVALLADDNTLQAQLLIAELYREIKDFEECDTILNSILQIEGYEEYLRAEIQRRTGLKEHEVFLLNPLIDKYNEERPKPTYKKVLNKHLKDAEQKTIDIEHLFDEDVTIADLINEITSLKENEIANLRYYSLGLNDIKEELTINFTLAKYIYHIDKTLNIKWITPTRLSITFDNNANTEYYIGVEFTGVKNEKRELLLRMKGELTKVEWKDINDISIQDRESIIQYSIYSYLDDNNEVAYKSSITF